MVGLGEYNKALTILEEALKIVSKT